MKPGEVEMAVTSLHVDLMNPTSANGGNAANKSSLAVIQVPMKLDLNTLTLMKESGNSNQDVQGDNSTSDSGLSNLDVVETPCKAANEQFKKSSAAGSNIQHVSDNGQSEHNKTSVQTLNFNLHVEDKSTIDNLSSQRFIERNVLAKKISENLSNGGAPKNIQLKERMRPKNKKEKIKLTKSKTYTDKLSKSISGVSASIDNSVSRHSASTMASQKTPAGATNTEKDIEWSNLRKQLHYLQMQGYDTNMALWTLMTSASQNDSTDRVDWRQIIKTMGQDSSDYFSIYPWSTRKKENTFSRLGEYLQAIIQENEVADHNSTVLKNKPPSGTKTKGPVGVKYTKSKRGITVKKDKSKTPGELAIDEARHKNSKLFSMSTSQSYSESVLDLTKPRTSHSLPDIAFINSSASNRQKNSNIHLPKISTSRINNNGKIYSGIYRLVTPPTKQRNAPTSQSLNAVEDTDSPLQVKTYGISNPDLTLPYTPRSSLSKGNAKEYTEAGRDNQFPFIYDEKYVKAAGDADPFIVNSLYTKHRSEQAAVAQSLYSQRSNTIPKPPPVTPNIRPGRPTIGPEEKRAFMIKYKTVRKSQTPLSSHRASFIGASSSGSEGDEVEGENAIFDDMSSINSLSVTSAKGLNYSL